MRRPHAPRFRPAVHALEDRRTPAVVAGTDGPDTFRVTPGETGAQVVLNGGAPVAVAAGEVIDLLGGAGDDYFEVSGLLPSNLVRVGGDGGHDVLAVRGSSTNDVYAAFDLSHGGVVRPGSAGVIFFTPDAGNAVTRVDVYGTPGQDAFTVHQVLPLTETWLHPEGGRDAARVVGGEAFDVYAAFDLSHGSVVRPGGKGVIFVTSNSLDAVATVEVEGSGASNDRFAVHQLFPLTEAVYDPNGGIDRASVAGGGRDGTVEFDVAATAAAVRVRRYSGSDVVLRTTDAANTVGRLDLVGTGASDVFHVNTVLPLTETWLDGNGGVSDQTRVTGGTTFDTFTASDRSHAAIVRPGAGAVLLRMPSDSQEQLALELVGSTASGDRFTFHQSLDRINASVEPNGGVDDVVIDDVSFASIYPDYDGLINHIRYNENTVNLLNHGPTNRIGRVVVYGTDNHDYFAVEVPLSSSAPRTDYVFYGLGGDDSFVSYPNLDGPAGNRDTVTFVGGAGEDTFVNQSLRVAVIGGEDSVQDRLILGNGPVRVYKLPGGIIYNNDVLPRPGDVVPTFANGAALANAGGAYAAGAWADADFLRLDALFAALQDTGKSFPLLRPPGTQGSQVAFRRQGGTGPGFNDGTTLAVADGPQQFGGPDDTALAGSVLTQLARFWTGDGFGRTLDGASRYDEFLKLSGWTSTPPIDLTNYNVSLNGGQPRYYLKSAAFVSEKAKTNEMEDFAETFSAFFAQQAGWNFYSGGPGAAAAPQKVALFQGWLAGLPVPA